MYDGTVEKSTLRQTEVGDGVPMLEAFDIGPVFLSCGRPPIGQCGCTVSGFPTPGSVAFCRFAPIAIDTRETDC
jgi:hypothetical protein